PGIECSRFVSLTDFLAKHLKCCICLNVFDKAVTNDCGHTYCRQCIGDWIASDRHHCPECRRPLATAVDTVYNFTINSMVGEMHVKCRYESEGCLEALELALMTAHEAVCAYRLCPTCGLSIGSANGGHVCPPPLMGDTAPEDTNLLDIDPSLIQMIENEIITELEPMDWSDVAGLEFEKNKIKEITVLPLLRPDLFQGLRKPPKGILLFGPPGTGKTFLGRCIASQTKSTLFSIRVSALNSEW
ncbi:unnamed protein product, partial [Medioppia subpectinata]